MFSNACEYGLKALAYIASRSIENQRVKIWDVSNYAGSPAAFTAKILGKLSKENILNSYTGPNGGFQMSPDQLRDVKVADVVRIIDGDDLLVKCIMGLDGCNADKPCPLHYQYAGIKQNINKMLTNTSIYDLAVGLNAGETMLRREVK